MEQGSERPKPGRPTAEKVLKWTLGLIGGGVLALVLLLAGAILVLRSPAVQQRIIASLEKPLAEQGVTLKVGSLRLDLLGGVVLEKLDLTVRRPPLAEGQIALETLRIRYALWPLLSRELEIREALIAGLSGDLRLKLEPSEPAPETPPDPEAPQKLLDLLRNPPLKVSLPKLRLERIRLRLAVEQGPMTGDFLLEDWNLSLGLRLDPGALDLNLEAELPTRINLKQAETLALKAGLQLKPQMNLEVRAGDKTLDWTLKLDDLSLQLAQLELAQRSAPGVTPASQLRAELGSLSFVQSLKASRQGPLPEKNLTFRDMALPATSEGRLQLNAPLIQFQQNDLGGTIGVTSDLQHQLQVPASLASAEDLDWKLSGLIDLAPFNLMQKGAKATRLARWKKLGLKLSGEGEQGQGKLKLTADADALEAPGLQKAIRLLTDINAEVNLKDSRGQGDLSVQLDGDKALMMTLRAVDQNAREADVKVELAVTPQTAWRNLHSGFAALDSIGWPGLNLTLDTKVLHPRPLSETQDLKELTITNQLTLKARQLAAGSQALLRFDELLLSLNAETKNLTSQGALSLELKKLHEKTLLKPIDWRQTLAFDADYADLIALQLETEGQLDGQKRLDLKLDLSEEPHVLEVLSQLRVDIDPKLKAYVPGLEILDQLGAVTLTSDDRIALRYPAARLREVSSWAPETLFAAGELKQTVTQAPGKHTYSLRGPLTITTQVGLKNAQLGVTTDVKGQGARAEGLAELEGLTAKAQLKVDHITKLSHIDLKAAADVGSVDPLLEGTEVVKDLIRKLRFQFQGRVEDMDSFHVDLVKVEVDQGLLSLEGKGNLVLKTGRGGFQGAARGELPEGRTIAGVSGRGGFALPFNLTLYDKKVLAIQADPSFRQLSFTRGDLAVENLDGQMTLNEELSIDEQGRIGFLYLNTQNPFTRVDFENVDPFLEERVRLRLDKLKFKHLEIGPMVQNFELRQNLILLNELKMNLLDGSALGRVFVDLHPQRLQLGFLGRFSNLQMELLKEPERRRPIKDVLSGRAAANFDIRKRLATGRVDVTSIGRNQLLSMIDILDPTYSDTQMMAARRALQVAYPTLVSVAMDQGLMDLRIGLGGVLSQDLSIRSVPLTAIINANAGEELMTLEKFLQTGGQSDAAH